MPVATAHAYREDAEPLLVTDKRGQRLKSPHGDSEGLPIGELGSKAIYQVHAERFIAVIPYK